MKVYWATKLRGFFRHLSERTEGVEFIDNANYYETNSVVSDGVRMVSEDILAAIGVSYQKTTNGFLAILYSGSVNASDFNKAIKLFGIYISPYSKKTVSNSPFVLYFLSP